MIDITDKKGHPLGLDYDYEYRGSRREKHRDMPYYRAMLLWLVIAALFAAGGVAVFANGISGENTFVGLFCFGAAALFVGLWLMMKRKHERLLEVIGKK